MLASTARHTPLGFVVFGSQMKKVAACGTKIKKAKRWESQRWPTSSSAWGADGHHSASCTVPSALTLKDMGMSPEDLLFQWKYQSYFKTDTPEEHTPSSPVPPRAHSRASYQASIRKARAALPVPLLLFQNGCLEPGAGTKLHQTPHVV